MSSKVGRPQCFGLGISTLKAQHMILFFHPEKRSKADIFWQINYPNFQTNHTSKLSLTSPFQFFWEPLFGTTVYLCFPTISRKR